MTQRREVAILVGVVALVAALAWALSAGAAEDTPPRPERPSPTLSAALAPVVGEPPKPRVVVTPVAVMPCPLSIAGISLRMPKTDVEGVVGKPGHKKEANGGETWYYDGAIDFVAFDPMGRVRQIRGYVLESPNGPIFSKAADNPLLIESSLTVELGRSSSRYTEVRLRDGTTLCIEDEGPRYYFMLWRLDY